MDSEHTSQSVRRFSHLHSYPDWLRVRSGSAQLPPGCIDSAEAPGLGGGRGGPIDLLHRGSGTERCWGGLAGPWFKEVVSLAPKHSLAPVVHSLESVAPPVATSDSSEGFYPAQNHHSPSWTEHRKRGLACKRKAKPRLDQSHSCGLWMAGEAAVRRTHLLKITCGLGGRPASCDR
ncbi:hypothetical protein NHX12_012599 [Muraenolepis orangiensis]|uniref:Uncharacterized protein n=1 Tax=Muraenolepis orangiensis TaxID=630683 RepID=A0A9Q0DD15_9TELE|nr:hypothetical protein NHX12_012599 [Muraenolepis orangiensis]